MTFSPPRRTAWILLVAALALPGWSVAHALIHQHLAHHHGEGAHHHGDGAHHHGDGPDHHAAEPATTQGTEALALLAEERAHEHGHLDALLIPASRSELAAPTMALSVASREPVVAPTATIPVAREGAPPRARPELADPSHPRAPPRA